MVRLEDDRCHRIAQSDGDERQRRNDRIEQLGPRRVGGGSTLPTHAQGEEGIAREQSVAHDEASGTNFQECLGGCGRFALGEGDDAVDEQGEGTADEHVELDYDEPLESVI